MQEKLDQMYAMGDGERKESADHTGSGEATDCVNDTMDGFSEPPVIPPAPPPPPIDGMPPTFGMSYSSHYLYLVILSLLDNYTITFLCGVQFHLLHPSEVGSLEYR